jgi:hypothetical protein
MPITGLHWLNNGVLFYIFAFQNLRKNKPGCFNILIYKTGIKRLLRGLISGSIKASSYG